MVKNFQEDDAISQIRHEVVHEDLVYALGVYPVFEDSYLSGFVGLGLRREVGDFLFFFYYQPVFVVEYLCAEKGVQPLVAREDAVGGDGRVQLFPFAGLDDFLCSFLRAEVVVIFGEGGGHILQDIAVCVSVAHIFAEVLDFPLSSIFLDVVVDPPQQNLLVAQSLHDVGRFVFLPEDADFREMFEGDFAADVDLGGGGGTLMICQMRPRTMCSLFSMMRSGWILTTVQPMALADSMARLRFSIFS